MELFFENPVAYCFDIICGFISPFIIMLVIEWLLPLRKKRWTKPVLYLGCAIFVGMIIYIGDPANLPGALLALLLAVLICCDGSYLQRFSIFLILSSLGLSFNAMADSFLIFYSSAWLTRNFLRVLIWLLVYFVLKRFAPKQEYNLPPHLWALVDVLTLTPFATTLVTVLLGDTEKILSAARNYLLLPIVTVSSFGLLWAVVILARQQKLEQEKSFSKLNLLYYKNLEQEQFQVRRLRHDMANHLQAMSALPEAEMRKYLNELIGSPAMENTKRFCENNVVNIVMASKNALMEQNNIDLEIEMSIPQTLLISDLDLCAVFANSLDNAIEACSKLPANERKILVKARVDKGLLILQVQNPTKENTALKNGLPISSKQNMRAHGFGLAGIREVALHYGGSMDITMDDGKFSLLIYIPLSDKN